MQDHSIKNREMGERQQRAVGNDEEHRWKERTRPLVFPHPLIFGMLYKGSLIAYVDESLLITCVTESNERKGGQGGRGMSLLCGLREGGTSLLCAPRTQ